MECYKWDELYISEEDDVTAKAIKVDIHAAGGINVKSSPENSHNNLDKTKNSEKFSRKENTDNNVNVEKDSRGSDRRENEKAVPLSINEFYMDQMNSSKNGAENSNENVKQNNFNYGNLTVKEDEDSLIIDFNPDVINPFGRQFCEIATEIKEHSPFRKFETYSVNICFFNFIFLVN
jgi:hypothetical protein